MPLTCDGLTVSSIEFASRDPSLTSLPSQLQGVARVVGLIHTTTDPGVLRHFLHLEVGEPCTELRRAESERTLRVQPYLADVTVRAVPDGSGGVRIEVETIDEIPTILRARFRGIEPRSLRFGHSNIAGEAISLAASAARGYGYRTGFGLSGIAYAAFGRPYTLALEGQREPLGSKLMFSLGHPFITDLQRTAWHMGYEEVHAYLSFVPPAGDDVSLGVRRRFWDIGGVHRVALGRWSAFAGGLFTHEAVIPADRAVIVSDSGLVTDTSAALSAPVPRYSNRRLNAVFGIRRLTYTPVRGFDALDGVQDMATGVQLATLFGWGIPRPENRDGDLFVSGDLYAGLGATTSFATLHVQAEGRNDHTTNRWDSMVGSGRLTWYLKPSAGHLLIASLAGGGAWREAIPFQLRLGDGEGGVRGYGGSRAAGGARAVGRL